MALHGKTVLVTGSTSGIGLGIASVLAAHGGGVPWWRVVRADGSLPPSHGEEARQAYLEEATPLRPSGAVDLTRAFWSPRLGAE